MSTFTDRLRIILPFVAFAAVVIILTGGIAPGHEAWAAALPWVLLVLFWVYLALMMRRARRSGRAH